jgi:hypothetical protein
MMRKFERDHKLPQGQLAIEEIPLDPDKQKQDWDVVYTPTGRVIDSILKVDREQAERLLKDVARLHDFENADHLELQSKGSDDPDSTARVKRKWEIIDRMDNNRVLDVVDDIDMMQAEAVRLDWVRRAGRGVDANIGKRSVPTAASAERARDRTNPNWRDELERHVRDADVDVAQNFSTPPAGFQTQRPATGDYYEVRGGSDNRIYGFFPTIPGHTAQIQNIATAAKRYVNDLTGRDDAFIQYRAGDPVQATAQNGVPQWELVDRMSGSVLHTITDHTAREAHSQAMAWLRSYGAEDPPTYSERFTVRPKMTV